MLQNGRFGKYEIVRKLSRSMTDVYLARDVWTNQRVVLKMIECARDEFTRLAIEAETRGAQIQKQLHQIDPRILEVYEFGEQDQCFFVAMEYFEGRTLAEILQMEHRLEARRAAQYAAEMCSQLRTLHSFVSDVNGRKTAVVHGDVKPANVQIGLKDNLKLLDFGIAKVITSTHHLTKHNYGSPSYCSPERLNNAQVDFHADLWALGVTLFESISGAPPYQAQDTRRLENLIQSKRPPRALPEDTPAAIKAIVSKALAGEIDQRYPSAEAFENDLRAFLQEQPIAAASERIVWDANATIERAGLNGKPTVAIEKLDTSVAVVPVGSKRTLWKRRASRGGPTKLSTRLPTQPPRPHGMRHETGNLAVALLAGILAGLLLFMPVAYIYRMRSALEPLRSIRDYAHDPAQTLASDWGLYQDLKRRNAFLGELSPVLWAEDSLRSNLLAAADNIIDGYRNSSDVHPSDFDWARARLCLVHALEIEPANTKAKGKLALCDGYISLIQNPDPPRASLSITSFRRSASYLPKSPDPHLGLARVYVYAFHNIGEAMPEFQQAQRLGYQLGPREIAEQADGYLYRSDWELKRARRAGSANKEQAEKWLQMASTDVERARRLYEPLVGFANVSTNLEQVYEDRSEQIKLEAASLESTPTTKSRSARRSGYRRWQ